MHFNRLDIIQAYCFFASEYHSSFANECTFVGRAEKLKCYSGPIKDYESLTSNGKEIFVNLCKIYGFYPTVWVEVCHHYNGVSPVMRITYLSLMSNWP